MKSSAGWISQLVYFGGIPMAAKSKSRDPARLATDDERIAHEANELLRKYGNCADIVAATQADLHFGKGDALGGTRWLEIFRRIAMSVLRVQRELH